MEAKVVEVMDIKHTEMPNMRDKFAINAQRCVTLSRQLVNEKADQRKEMLLRNTFKAIHENKLESLRRNRLMQMMVRHFRKYHVWHEFRKLR